MKILPNRRYHKTPRPLRSDAYTVCGYTFESAEATEQSKYYGMFRKFPHRHEPTYSPADERIVFAGLQPLVDQLFYEPITHEEIDETVAFLKGRKVKNDGTFADFEFPEALWRRVVDEKGGWLPLRVEGMPEGSVVYPHEPFLRVTATETGFGPLVPWFESTLLHVWAATERLTAARHFLKHTFELIRRYEPETVSDEECLFFARVMIHDFGDRAGASPMESELVSRVHNYVWFGTDTFRAAYQNWKNGAPAAFGSSVKALAHRIVQGYAEETDCYNTMYHSADGNELLSMVGDCYDYWSALEKDLIPLALKAKNSATDNANTIVARPDSGDSVDMVLGTLQRAHAAGLMEDHLCADGITRHVATNLRYIVGNGESFDSVLQITNAALDAGFVPWRCGIYGIGGHLRNNINRDHMSTKFALCAVGEDERPVIKLSNTPGKQTLPDCHVLRDDIALTTGVTLVTPGEVGVDALVTYYDGSLEEPFGSGFTDDFLTCEARVVREFDEMPLTGGKRSELLQGQVEHLIEHYRG